MEFVLTPTGQQPIPFVAQLPFYGASKFEAGKWFQAGVVLGPTLENAEPMLQLYWQVINPLSAEAISAAPALVAFKYPLDLPLSYSSIVLGGGAIGADKTSRDHRFQGFIDDVILEHSPSWFGTPDGLKLAAEVVIRQEQEHKIAAEERQARREAIKAGTWVEPEVKSPLVEERSVFADQDKDGFTDLEEALTGGDVTKSGGNRGYYRHEIWDHVTGDSVGDFYRWDKSFLASQSTSNEQASLDFTCAGTNLAHRISGLIHPPVTGLYKFWIASDNHSEMWLSSNDSTYHRHRIAYVAGAVGPHAFEAQKNQVSESIFLDAKQNYFFEIFHKEGGHDNHLSVAWQLDIPNWCLSKGSVATQSSTAFDFSADRAADGNIDGRKPSYSFSQTDNQRHSWWHMDFGQPVPINRIVLHNRKDYPERLSNFWISLLDKKGRRILAQDFFEQEGTFVKDKMVWDLPQTIDARHLRIKLNRYNGAGDGYLALAEVQALYLPDIALKRQIIAPEYISTPFVTEGDTDNDGMPDEWEAANGLNPKDNGLHDRKQMAWADPDGDSFTNLEEYQFGGRPLEPDSFSGSWTREWWGKIHQYSVPVAWQQESALYAPSNRITRQDDSTTGKMAGEYFAARIRGYVAPPTSGHYRFWLAGKTAVQLSLSTSSKKWDKHVIAALDPSLGSGNGIIWDRQNRWDNFASQVSREIYLEAGKPYFIEILHQHGHSQNSYAAVAWAGPDGMRAPIPSSAISSYLINDAEDTDDDSLPDAWEAQYGLDTHDNGYADRARQGERGDLDGDGLSNLEEYQLHTNPDDKDTDGDGRSDGEEYRTYRTDPNTKDGNTIRDIAEINPMSFSTTNMKWHEQGNGIVAGDYRGAIEWKFDVKSPGYYGYALRMSLNGQALPSEDVILKLSVDAIPAAASAVNFRLRTPTLWSVAGAWLEPGTHTLKLFIDNNLVRRSLILHSLSVFAPEGPDFDQDRVPDWFAAELDREYAITNPPALSTVSPVCLEGIAPGNPGSVRVQGTPVQPLGDHRWFTNVALTQGANTIETQFPGRGVKRTNISWQPTNVLADATIDLRVGDSLLLAAFNPNGQTVKAETSLGNGKPFRVHDGTVQSFDKPGTFTLSSNGPGGTGTLTVRVAAATLPDEILVVANLARSISLPKSSLSPGLVLAGTGGLEAEQTGESVMIMAASEGTLGLSARLRPGGPILAASQVHSIVLSGAMEQAASMTFSGGAPNGYYRIRSPLYISGLPEGATVEVKIFRAGVMFHDGSVFHSYTAADFADGLLWLEFFFPSHLSGGYCHYVTIKDKDGKVVARK